ncbi:hypothetical protein PI124_g19737 [Phytophthora idaei]|nr:hypothetical protein PI124_g19737 [Phytophthora idaei]
MQTARKASITFLARLLFFDTLPNRQQQAVETAAAAGRPHPVQAWPDLEGDAVVEWQRVLSSAVSGTPQGTVATTREQTPDSSRRDPAARTPPMMLQEVHLNKLVAFTPEREAWMKSKHYRPIGPTYIVGRVCRRPMRGKFVSLFEIRWLDSQFQDVVEHVSVGCDQSGVKTYKALTRLKDNPDWQKLVTGDDDDDIDVDDHDDLQAADDYAEFDPGVLLPASLEEVEAIQNLRFEPSGEYKHLFEHSATSSFFAYLRLYFWHQVLFETNKYAVVYDIKISTPFTLAELMAFLGIIFYMVLNDKGEYVNYWGQQPEDMIFGGNSISLDSMMSLNRYKLLRCCLSFNAVPNTLDRDAAARIRPPLNLLKVTGGLYIKVGRNVALDEASVACRSRQGRHTIVFNPMKPTGIYHFRFYVACCSSIWIALNYKLHCNRCDLGDRVDGVIGHEEAQSLRAELGKVSKIRQHVLEVVRPLFGTKRIINMDNYYLHLGPTAS